MVFSEQGFKNVAILTLAQVFAFTAVPMLMFIGSFIGAKLAPSQQYATLPIAVMVVGTALGTVPAALLMQRFGRKIIFISANLMAASACVGVAMSLATQSFLFYCGFIFVIGVAMAVMQQFRFAAMESVAVDKMPAAASYLLLGGVIAAFIGPELALIGKHITAVEYQGSFYFAMTTFLMCAVCLLFFKSQAIKLSVEQVHATRSLPTILNSRVLWLAIASAAIGYALMSFIMTATPISMHHLHGHSETHTKWVIQSHIAFMFLPSLISPVLIRYLGLHKLIALGLVAYSACIIIAFSSSALWAFWTALVLLGIGWNFLFVAGTSLLPQCYEEGEQFKVQAFNDAMVFSLQAIAALSAGFVLQYTSWTTLLLSCIPLMMLLLYLLVASRVKKVLK